MASGKGADSAKIDKFWAFGVPSISAVPEAGNPENPQEPWKWLPEKERSLQNRQVLGLCGVPLHFGGPRGRKSRKFTGALDMASGKGAGLYKIDKFRAFVGFPLHFGGPKAGNPENQTRNSTKSTIFSTNFGLLWGSLYFGGPRGRKSRKSTGAREMASEKERTW